jgi:transposase-like protein
MRCPSCGSLETKRNGKTSTSPLGVSGPLMPLQRFLCTSCSTSFTTARTAARRGASFTDGFAIEAVRLYVQGMPSYRTLAALLEPRVGRPVSRMTLNRWVQQLGAAAKTPLQVSAELAPPNWSGILGIDGKAVWVAGEERCLLVGVDQETQDVVHALMVRGEDGESFERLVREAVTVAGYPLRGVVIDGSPPFLTTHAEYFPLLPLQVCRVHASRRLDHNIAKAKRSPDAAIRAELKDRVRGVLFAASRDEARDRLFVLLADRERYAGIGRRDTLVSLERLFGLYTTHHAVEGMPPDTNVTENVIKQLSKKIRLIEGFTSMASAERFSRLLVGCYRFKRFTDSCQLNGNGRSPLELAGVDGLPGDWLPYLLTPPREQHQM